MTRCIAHADHHAQSCYGVLLADSHSPVGELSSTCSGDRDRDPQTSIETHDGAKQDNIFHSWTCRRPFVHTYKLKQIAFLFASLVEPQPYISNAISIISCLLNLYRSISFNSKVSSLRIRWMGITSPPPLKVSLTRCLPIQKQSSPPCQRSLSSIDLRRS